MATVINFVVDAGSKFEGVATIQNEDGSLFDLTNYDTYAQMRKSFYSDRNIVEIQASVQGDPQNGEILLELDPSVTADLPTLISNNWVYDIEANNPLDATDVKRVCEGTITVNPNATKSPVVP